jgi:large subunit ribosomal protein L18
MSMQAKNHVNRMLRKLRIRARVNGTTERPRLTVYISNLHVSAQIVDDTKGHTVASSTSTIKGAATGTKSDKAAWVGADIAKKAKKAGVKAVVFDRNGRQYSGRLKALADAARKEGLEF